MKKLSMILTVLIIFGSSAIGHTSDECVVFEGIFEKSTRRPVVQFKYFEALDGDATLKVYDEAGDHHAKKVRSATISVNGKKVVRSRDFSKKKFFHYSHFKQTKDYIDKTVKLTKGQNSLEVMLNCRRGGKIKVVIAKPKFGSIDSDCDFISDDGNQNGIFFDSPCTGGSTALCDDNCPNDFNPDQADSDGDGIGDVCDDGDGYPYNVIATVDVGSGSYGGISVSPDGAFVYVSNYSDGSVSVIKTADNSVMTTIPVEAGRPIGVSMVADGAFVYVNNYASHSVSVIETTNNTVIQSIPVGNNPFGISVTPDGKYAYVSNFGSDTVSVIDTANHEEIYTIYVEDKPWGVSATSDGEYVYVTNYGSGTVSVIETNSNSVIQSVPVGEAPSGVSVTPNGAFVYVNSYGSDTVSVVRTSDYAVLDPINVGNGPDGISMTPSGAYAYVNNYLDDTVSVIQTSDNSVIDTIDVGDQPRGGIAVSPDGRFVYVANFSDGTVSVIGY